MHSDLQLKSFCPYHPGPLSKSNQFESYRNWITKFVHLMTILFCLRYIDINVSLYLIIYHYKAVTKEVKNNKHGWVNWRYIDCYNNCNVLFFEIRMYYLRQKKVTKCKKIFFCFSIYLPCLLLEGQRSSGNCILLLLICITLGKNKFNPLSPWLKILFCFVSVQFFAHTFLTCQAWLGCDWNVLPF